MLKRLVLCHKITKFYKIFGEALDIIPCRTHMSDLTTDYLLGVKFDVAEALEAQANIFDEKLYPLDIWLQDLYNTLDRLTYTDIFA